MPNDSNNNNNDNTAITDFTANRENTMKEELACVLKALPEDQKKEFSNLYAKYKAQQDTNNNSAQDNPFSLFNNTASEKPLQQVPTLSENHSKQTG